MCQDSRFTTRSFLLKDVYDQGLAAASGLPPQASAMSSDVFPAVMAMDQAFAADGRPNYDLHIWMALCRLMITVGDLLTTAIQVGVTWDNEQQRTSRWDFSYSTDPGQFDFDNTELGTRLPGYLSNHPFLELKLLEGGPAEGENFQVWVDGLHPTQFPTKVMGAIDPRAYVVKLESYPIMVHPKLRQRAAGTIATMIAMWLAETGIVIHQSWFPEDTSHGFARYILSDGIEHYQFDFHAPFLAYLMSKLDTFAGRSEDEGRIVLDALDQPTDLSQDNPELPG